MGFRPSRAFCWQLLYWSLGLSRGMGRAPGARLPVQAGKTSRLNIPYLTLCCTSYITSSTMKGVVIQGVRDVAVHDVPMPTIKADTDVILKTRLSGLCGKSATPSSRMLCSVHRLTTQAPICIAIVRPIQEWDSQ